MVQFYTKQNSMRLVSSGSLRPVTKAVSTPVEKVALDPSLPLAAYKGIGLVKINVEGFEPQVLEGMRNIVMAVEPMVFNKCIKRALGEAVQQFLEPLGYSFFEVHDSASAISKVVTVAPHFNDQGWPLALSH